MTMNSNWLRDCGRKKAEIESKNKTPDTSKSEKNKKRLIGTDSAIRKRAERVRSQLPDSPKSWAKTRDHLVKNATPRRKKLLDPSQHDGNMRKEMGDILEVKKVGRPSKKIESAKKALAFDSGMSPRIWSKISSAQYKRRKRNQKKNISKIRRVHNIWRPKVVSFLEEKSRVMPNKKDTVIINGEHVAKRHLLIRKVEAFRNFREMYPDFPRNFTTFLKMTPKNFKSLNLSYRQVCVCIKDYNLEQKVGALNKLASSLDEHGCYTSVKQLSDITLCKYKEFPERSCTDRTCEHCSTNAITEWYRTILAKCSPDKLVKYIQWQNVTESYQNKHGEKKTSKRWIQVEKKTKPADLIKELEDDMVSFPAHIFRSNYQQTVQRKIIDNLPMDHCLVIMDFSENMSLQPQDEIEGEHWTMKQITIHPIYIARHSPESTESNPIIQKESLTIVSDSLEHNTNVVQVFTDKLVSHLNNNPGPCRIKVIHRFSDNCACQYKCAKSFYNLGLLENKHDIRMIYHYTESGHGKGPSDGIGAAIKKKLDRLIIAGHVINNAYNAYLTLSQNPSENKLQIVIYVPNSVIKNLQPNQPSSIKSVKGTQSYHRISTFEKGSTVLVCEDLSCSCDVCLTNKQGPCPLARYRKGSNIAELILGKRINATTLPSDAGLSSNANDTNNNPNPQMDVLAESIISNENQLLENEREMSLFKEKVNLKGLRVRGETPMDGNCLFWAVSDQLDRIGDAALTHTQLRRMVVEYIRELSHEEKTELSNFLTDNITTYLKKMAVSGNYGDQICLEQLAKILKTSIRVVHAGDDQDVLIGDDHEITFLLGFLPELQHYVSLECSLEPNDYVGVRLEYRRRKSLHIAKVLKVDASTAEIELLYLQPVPLESGIYKWPKCKETSWEPSTHIIRTLPSQCYHLEGPSTSNLAMMTSKNAQTSFKTPFIQSITMNFESFVCNFP